MGMGSRYDFPHWGGGDDDASFYGTDNGHGHVDDAHRIPKMKKRMRKKMKMMSRDQRKMNSHAENMDTIWVKF
jgi:hypothetical protein